MNDIYNLLGINSDVIRDFSLLANRVIDYQMEKILNKQISHLKQIEERTYVEKGLEVSLQSIDEIIRKVRCFSRKDDSSIDNWTIRELRIISYYLMKFRDNSKDYFFALSLLEKGWRNIFFNGLVFFILNSWNSIEFEYREATCNLIIQNLRKYKDGNKRYLLLKDHINLFEKNGPLRLSALVAAKDINIADAPLILGFKSTALKQSYYSEVIIRYIENKNIQSLDLIENIFQLHNLDRTKKLVFAYLVEKADQHGDGIKRAFLCKFINRILGDVTLASTWAPFAGATLEEAQRLKRAMRLVYMWFAQQIIEVFFEVCVQDKDRKDFWTKYVDKLSGFKIVGSTATKRLLQNDSRISGMFAKHFIETNSLTSQTSALILFIKNKMIVEFSDTGALYVYNQDHSQVKLVTRSKFINSTNDLKIPSMKMLIEADYWGGYDYNQEGRMTHQGHWRSRLSTWMNRIVLSNNQSVSFIETQNDELFKATPLPKEEPLTIAIDQTSTPKSIHRIKETKSLEEEKQNIENESLLQAEEEDFTISYEKNLAYRISSKWFNGKRVVANAKGYYLNLIASTQFAKIKNLKVGMNPIGNLWIKQSRSEGWIEIIHFCNGTENSIGFLKEDGEQLIYKRILNHEKEFIIKL